MGEGSDPVPNGQDNSAMPDIDKSYNGTCICPLAKDHAEMRLAHTERLPMRAQEAYKLVFQQEKFMLDVLASRKATNYAATAWSPDPQSKLPRRSITYDCPIPLTSKMSHCSETQTMSNLTRAGEVYVVNNEVNNEGVPFADSFYISVHICIVRVSAADVQDDVIAGVTEWCQYSCYSSVQYKKSVWGVLKGQLERATYSGMEGIHRDVAAALRDYAVGSMSASDVRAAKAIGQNARKKKRSKTTSSDFGHSNKKTKDDVQRISWAHGILNTSLVISALLLVVLNVNLFAKVQYLETVSKNLTLASHCPALLATPFTDQLLTSDPNSDDPQEIWELVKNLLASQKASYSAELRQMGSHLLQATRALDQADSELHIVLDHLPHSLDVLADAVKEQIREEQVMGKISDVFKRVETRQLDNKAQT